MKTKHILTALALPAIFAACTAEDVVSESANIQVERAKLSENFKLKVNADGVDSRYAVSNGKSSYNTGDRIGAFIVDSKIPGTPMAEWDVIDTWASNVPFTYNEADDSWNTPEGMWVNEGHNFFKYPYNENDRTRGAVYFEMPTIQNQYTSVNGAIDNDAPISADNMSISVALLDAETEAFNLQLKNIFTYPKFTIQFDNGEKVNTVSKVAIFKADTDGTPISNGFVVKSGFNHKAVATLFKTSTTDWDKVTTEELIYDAEAENLKEFKKETYLIAQLPNNAKTKLNSNTSNKYIDVRFVLPAIANYDDVQLGMYIYTDNGMYWIKDVQDYIQFKETTDAETKAKVLARNKNYNLTLQAVDEDELEKNAEMIVSNNKDWNDLVNVYGGVKGGVYSILVVGDEFAFDATTKMPSKAIFNLDNAAVKGEATLSNVSVTGETHVAEGAELTTTGSFSTGTLHNEGEVIVSKVVNASNQVVNYDGISTILNEGTLTIAEDAEASFELYNAKDAVVNNNGEVSIEDAEYDNGTPTDTSDDKAGNYGVINNEGVINLNGDFTQNYQEKSLTNAENVSFIYNEGEIFAEDGDLTIKEDAEVVNKAGAVMTCKNHSGEIINEGKLTVEDTSVTYITENEGTIYVDKAVPAKLDIKDSEKLGTIEYSAEGEVSFKNSLVNKVNVVDDLEITNQGNVTELYVEANAEIEVPETAEFSSLTVAKNVTATLDSDFTTDALTVEKNAKLYVSEDMTLTVVTSAYTNNGNIIVGRNASLYAEEVSQEVSGTVKDNGTSLSIVFKNELAALWYAAVVEWAQFGNMGDGWSWWIDQSDATYYEGNPYAFDKFVTITTTTAGNWSTRPEIVALLEQYEGAISASDAEAKECFEAAITKLLTSKAVENAAKASLYDGNGNFKISWNVENQCFESKAEVLNDMTTRLSTSSVISNYFSGDAVAAAYVHANKATVFNKLIAANPYAYVWEGDDCVLYEVIKFINDYRPTAANGWKSIDFSYAYTDITTIASIKLFISDAITYEGSSEVGKKAKALGQKYIDTYKAWGYNDTQVDNVWKAYNN